MTREIKLNYATESGFQIQRKIFNISELSGNFDERYILSSSSTEQKIDSPIVLSASNVVVRSKISSYTPRLILSSSSPSEIWISGSLAVSHSASIHKSITFQNLVNDRAHIISTGRLILSSSFGSQIHVSGAMSVSGNVGIGVDPQASTTRLAIWDASGPAVHLRRDGSNEWYIRTHASPSERLAFRAGGDTEAAEKLTIEVAGNVGIGIANPAARLHISGNDEAVRIQGSTHCYMTFYPDGPATRKAYLGFGDTHDSKLYFVNESGSGGHIALIPGASAGVAIKRQASFDALNTLHVDGTVRISNNDESWTTAGWAKGICFPNQGYALMWNAATGSMSRGIGTTSNGYFYLIRSPSSGGIDTPHYDMVTDTLGRTSMGTATPEYQFHVYNTAATTFAALFNNQGASDVANNHGIIIRAGKADASGQTSYVYCLDRDGTEVGYIENNAGTFRLVDSSDPRVKRDVNNSQVDALGIIDKFNTIEYRFAKHGPQGQLHPIGFDADNCKQVFPEMVSEGKDGRLFVSKADVVPVLVKALQQALRRIETLESGSR
jgi:hypothetical protein